MNKVISKDFRRVKEFTLPQSGITIECYSCILVKDITELAEKKDIVTTNVEVILKVIKSWNFYENETDEKPLPITVENFNKIPAPDFQYLAVELEKFSSEQKKS